MTDLNYWNGSEISVEEIVAKTAGRLTVEVIFGNEV